MHDALFRPLRDFSPQTPPHWTGKHNYFENL